MSNHCITQIIHHVQTNESIHLSDKSRWDIEGHVMGAIREETDAARRERDWWKNMYLDTKKVNFPLKWNELRLWLKRNRRYDVLEVIEKLNKGESIR